MRPKLAFCFLVLILITSCASPTPGTAIPPTETPTRTPTPIISPTPAAPMTILVLPADLPQDQYDYYQTLVYDLATSNGMKYKTYNSLSADDIQAELPALKVVIALPPDPGLAALAAAAPGVQFLAVNIPDLPAAPNLSTIGAGGLPVDQQAFLAGYIAGMLAPEWRVGLLTQKDTSGGDATWTAFTNGYHYYCGYCRNPNFTQPSYDYPIVVRIPTDATPDQYDGYAKVLLDYFANVIYVYQPVATPDVLTYLTQYGKFLIGQDTPSNDIRGNWIASIQPDLIGAVKNIFPELVAGHGGQVVPTPLYLNDVSPQLLSEGKLRLAQEVLDGLQHGTISTGVTP